MSAFIEDIQSQDYALEQFAKQLCIASVREENLTLADYIRIVKAYESFRAKQVEDLLAQLTDAVNCQMPVYIVSADGQLTRQSLAQGDRQSAAAGKKA